MRARSCNLAIPALLAAGSYAQDSYATNGSKPIVDLGYAQYMGNTSFRSNFSVDVFYGISYAQAPIGNLRWQAPQDIEAHNDYGPSQVIDAQAPGPSCVQGTPQWRAVNRNLPMPVPVAGEEDCLHLDIYVPTKPKSDYLPVLIQVHGGGYTQGSSQSPPGQAIVGTSDGNMIYVSIQYRLSVYGFLSSSEIRENGAANAGLLDQRAAFHWVQRNIRAFGGDPGKVTITGGSAGGGSVMDQMIMYGGVASPPFRAVIAEYPWWQPYHNNTILEGQYRGLLATTNCSDLVCLRSLDTEVLKVAQQQTYVNAYYTVPDGLYGYGDFYYGPSVDGDVIRDLPSNEFKQGHFTKVPLIVDHDGYEGYLYSNMSENTQALEQQGWREVFPYAKQSFFDRLYQLYPRNEFNGTFWQRAQIWGDYIIDCPTYYMATAVADAGLATYKLIFNAGTQLHGATSPFIYNANDDSAVNNATIASYMKDWIISFVTDLDPNANTYSNDSMSKPYWPQYNPVLGTNGTAPEFAIMDINYTQIGVIPDLDANPRCDFFHGSSYDVRN